MSQFSKITISTRVKADLSRAWEVYTNPEYIMKWNHASDDWHCPKATNDLRVGGKFSSTMSSKDGKTSFDFEGIYDEVLLNQRIAYSLEDGRKVVINFAEVGGGVDVQIVFDAEGENDIELQESGWGAILENYRKIAETF